MIYVDVPKHPDRCENEDETWESVKKFKTRKEAIDFITETWGLCDEEGRVKLMVDCGEEPENEEMQVSPEKS